MQQRLMLIGIAALAVTASTASPQDGPKVSAPARDRGQAAGTPLSPARLTKGLDATAIFIENRGQFDQRVKFQVRIAGKTAWLTGEGIVFDVTRLAVGDPATSKLRTLPRAGVPPRRADNRSSFVPTMPEAALQTLDRLVFAEDFIEMNCCSKIEGRNVQPGAYNYFLGPDASKWATDVHIFSEVVYRDIWPGVDLRVYGNGSNLEQEFIIQPGGDLNKVKISYRGVDKLEIGEDGSLEISTAFGLLRETKPKLFQEIDGKRDTVQGRYRLTARTSYTFDMHPPNSLYTLVIDPTLLFSTFVGGSGQGIAGESGVASDSSGNAYIAGTTLTGTYPTTTGVFQVSCPSSCSNPYSTPFVSKFDPLGRLQYSTFLGSTSGGDTSAGIAVDSKGNAYLTGNGQPGFPTTASAYRGCPGVFMTELNPSGSSLLYSTCLGTGVGYGIAVGANGKAYLTGYTGDSRFPITSGALQSNWNTSANAFVSVIDPTLTGAQSLVYSTYLGGVSIYVGGDGGFGNFGYAIAVDSFGSAYVTGITYAANFPVTSYAFQSTNHEGVACNNGLPNPITCGTGFVSKINPNISGPNGLIYSTYLGGSVGGGPSNQADLDAGTAIAVDTSGNVFVGGYTRSNDFPTTTGAFHPTGNNNLNCFVTKLNAGGSSLVYSTFLSQSPVNQNCRVNGIALDVGGNVYVTGATSSGNFPTTLNASQTTYQGGLADAYLSELNSSGSALLYSSFLGGIGSDGANGVTVDAVGDVFVAGATSSVNFPTTQSAYQPLIPTKSPCGSGNSGFCYSAFLTKFPLGAPGTLAITGVTPATGGNNGTVSPTIVGSGFHAGASVALHCGGQVITGSSPSVSLGGRTINTTFDLTASSPGDCTMVVTNPDGTTVSLPQGLLVTQGGAPRIQISKIGSVAKKPPLDTSGWPTNVTYLITETNTGNVDAANMNVSDLLEPEFTLTSVSPSAVASVATLASNSVVFWSLPTLPAGASVQLAYSATISPSTPVGTTIIGGPACFTPQGALWTCINNIAPGDALTCPTFVVAALSCPTACVGGPVPCGLCYSGALLASLACGLQVSRPIFQCVQNLTTNCTSFSQQLQGGSADPNNLIGPPGVGQQKWIGGSLALTYGISFANEVAATAPAKSVIIVQPISANMDLSTLRLSGIILPNNTEPSLQVPTPTNSFNPGVGLNEFTTNVDLRPTQSLLVAIDAKLDQAAATLTWTFTSIDPSTGAPTTDAAAGFLPPGAAGSVFFTIQPKRNVATSSIISDQASVVFDTNAAISTPTWTNTIDSAPPTSHVSPLSVSSTCPAFRVSWYGSDVGSGLQSFTVYVSDTGTPFTAWLSNTTAVSAVYIGQVGHTYSFYTIATDLVGNVEGAKTAAEALTSVTATGSCGAPSLNGQISNVAQSGTTVTATLTLANTGLTAAQSVNINQITLRTLGGNGTVMLTSPSLPLATGPLAIGATTTVPLTFMSPTSVTRFSLTEGGTVQDASGNGYSFSIGQTIIP